MAAMTISLLDPMKEWIEKQILAQGEYASASDYVRDLIRRDRENRAEELTLDELRTLVANAKASGISPRGVRDIFAAAKAKARSRGAVNE